MFCDGGTKKQKGDQIDIDNFNDVIKNNRRPSNDGELSLYLLWMYLPSYDYLPLIKHEPTTQFVESLLKKTYVEKTENKFKSVWKFASDISSLLTVKENTIEK